MNKRTACVACQAERLPVFQVVLYLKDEHSMGLDEVYKVHYYSQVIHEEEDGTSIADSKLFRIAPCNLYAETEKRNQIKDYLHLLFQYNV